MRDFKKSRGRRAQYLRMAAGLSVMVLLALVAFGTGSAAWGMYGKFAEAAAADEAGQKELANLQAQYDDMQKTVDNLSTPRGMEAAVRERYGVGKPGEGEIDIIQEATTTAAAADAPEGFWASLWHALFVW